MTLLAGPTVASADEGDRAEFATTAMNADTSVPRTVDPAAPIQPGDYGIEGTVATPSTRVPGDHPVERTAVPNVSRAVAVRRLSREDREPPSSVSAIPRLGPVFAACVAPPWKHSLPRLFIPIGLAICVR